MQGDETAIVKYANNRNVWLNLRDSFPYPYAEENARAWLRKVRKCEPERDFAIVCNHEAIGGIGLHPQRDVYRRSAEIGYWIGEPFWSKGIATRAVRAFTDYALANFDLIRIYASVFEGNVASARVLEKAGYTFEGRFRKAVTKDRKTLDQLIFAFVR